MKAAILLLSIILCGANPSFSEDATHIMGLGALPCGIVTTFYDSSSEAKVQVTEWSAGFMSGLNAANITARGAFRDMASLDVPGETRSDNSILHPIIKVCREQPFIMLIHAAQDLYGRLPERSWATAGHN